MRILIPTHFPLTGSGSGVYVENLARQIVRAGHAAHVIAPEHHALADRVFPCTTITFAGGEAQNPDLPFNFPCFTTHPRSSNTFYALTPDQTSAYVDAFRRTIASATAAFRPDLIHAQHLWVAAFCTSEMGLPFVVTSHGTDLIGYRRDARFRQMVETAAGRAARIIAISRQVADDIRSLLSVPQDRIALVGNGFDPAIFHPAKRDRATVLAQAGIADTARRIVIFIGKLADFKGADVLLRSADIYEDRAGAATLLVGDGELRDALRRLAESLHLRRVHFLGHRPQAEVADLLRIADVCAMPSRGEPFGLAAVESLACGTPVVGTRAGGLPDFLSEDLGALVPVDDPAAFAEAVVREIETGSKASKGPAAARYAIANFTWERQVARTLRIYEDVLAPP